ncbi:MAG TPA: DUF6670 family protein [Jatrophihabitantaceae bacterium]|nr:DUF6670 family protein [Jatrophihabitantaceae bacterium]
MHLPIPAPLARSLRAVVNPVHRLDGRRFDPATPFGPPHGRYSTVHYGVMIPGLPEPHRFLDVIAVIGQPPVALWRNSHLVQTSDRDTVSLLTATGAMTTDQLQGYSVAEDCELSPDGSSLRFGDRLLFEGSYPDYSVRITHPQVTADLHLHATGSVTHFARLPGGLYDHWSLLCQYTGRIGGVAAAGLCTLEYARGVALRLPLRSFAYSVLNVDDRTQVLMGQVLGPGGLPVQRVVSVRGLDEPSQSYSRGFRFDIHGFESEARATPDGRWMLLPREFEWQVDDGAGGRLIRIAGRMCGDFTYGMAAGFAGSYRYEGEFRGRAVEGTGYLEYIDGR